MKRASVRELAQGANYPSVRMRPGSSGPGACRDSNCHQTGQYDAEVAKARKELGWTNTFMDQLTALFNDPHMYLMVRSR